MSSYRYKAFISYSHKDSRWAHWLHKELERFHIHKHLVGQETAAGKVPASLLPVFLDRVELASATDLGALLTDCLQNSWCQIVICSPAAAKSRWVNEEILTFKRLGKGHRIFSLIVDGEPYATDSNQPEQECFPPALRFQLDEHGQLSKTPAEPIAADARPGKDKKRNALYKIVAGMLGVGFDTLKQRELQRRQRKMALISIATTVGMLCAMALALDAMVARDEAQSQRNRAEIEAQTANRTASFMISLFSVADPSEARGNTITAREILDNGAHRIEQELQSEPAIQANLMNTIGQVYTSLGLYQRAADLLESALKVRQSLRAEDKITAAELSESMDALARIYTELASYEQAEALFERALVLLELQDQPNSSLAADIQAGKAELYFRMGRYADAEPLLQQVLVLRRFHHGEPSLEAAQATQQIGLNWMDQGQLEKAETYLRDALEQMQLVLGNQPHPALAENINNLAYVSHSLGKFEQARIQYEQALDMHRVLLGDDHPDVATAHINLAMLYQDAGRYEEARSMFETSIKILHRAYGDAHPKIAKAMNNLAYLLYDQKDAAGALQLMEQVVSMAQATLGEQHADLARYLSTEGRWLAEAGRHQEAVVIHRRALQMKVSLLGENHPNVAISEFDLAESLLGLGENQEALSLAQHAVNALVEAHGETHWYVAIAKLTLARALMAQNALAEAEPLLLDSYAQLAAEAYVPVLYVHRALQRLVELYTLKNVPTQRDKFKAMLAKAGA